MLESTPVRAEAIQRGAPGISRRMFEESLTDGTAPSESTDIRLHQAAGNM